VTTVPDFDIGIIGGGPAGASMAGYLAKAGVSCVVLERDLFPRPHVGESLVPSSTRVFRDLDFLPTMEREKFPHKYGAAWTATNNSRLYDVNWDGLEAGEYADFLFQEREQEGVNQDYTYHVDRGKFDLLLLQHVNQMGAAVYEGVRVDRVDFSDPELVSIHYKMGRSEQKITARMVVDATGRNTLLGNQLGWKIKDPVFDQYALHTWFDNYDRGCVAPDATKNDYIYIHFLPVSNTWMWQIPITDTITSIGVVTQKSNFAKRKTEHEPFFWDMVDSRPEFGAALRQAERIRPFRTEGDYSYAMKQIVGDRLVLVGDAGRFVDPIFSTGVSIALNSSRFAHKDVLGALETGDFSAESFRTFEATLRRGTRNWHEFISVYYRLNVLFTAFVRDPRYRLDVLKLLQGDVYDEDEPPVLARMKAIVSEVERNPKHLWHDLLNDLTSNAFAPAF
jgi:1H-pyrrole-2-carbonyl-[peptidyl-carrier protein] chlorinase